MPFYYFRQNNFRGIFEIDDAAGIGPSVWVEAQNYRQANSRALSLGIYFDGVKSECDCECCGERWYPACKSDAEEAVRISLGYDFSWHNTVYVHTIDGEIHRVTKRNVFEMAESVTENGGSAYLRFPRKLE